MIDFYRELGPLGYLANYSDYGFYKDGTYYKTVEHYYQASKFKDQRIREKILNAETAREAAAIGRDRNNKRIDGFNDIKLEIMEEGIYYKFLYNPDIREKLIATKKQSIRELTENEYFWGTGTYRNGENNIGQILENVREKVKKDLIRNLIVSYIGRNVVITGHKNPSIDSITSSLILSNILKNFGVNSKPVIRDDNYKEKNFFKEIIPMDIGIQENFSNSNVILVDSSNSEEINDNNIIFSFDNEEKESNIINRIGIKYASTALMLYDLFKDIYEFSEEEKRLICLTVLSETKCFTDRTLDIDDIELYYKLKGDLENETVLNNVSHKSALAKDVLPVLVKENKK